MIRRLAVLLIVAVAAPAGCSGGQSTGGTGPTTTTTGGDGDGDRDDDDRGGDPAARLRDLVDDVVSLSGQLECAQFGAELRDWTDAHAGEIGRLVDELEEGGGDQLAELSAYVDEQVLQITEAAADCGSEDAWDGWEHLEHAIDECRQ